MKELYEYLKEKFNIDEPIFIKEITGIEMTSVAIRKGMERLVKDGLINRFSNGVYYIPAKTILGKKKLSSNDVIQKKYIRSDNRIYGFYSGLTFENKIGLTTQVPNVIEIVSNNEPSIKRTIKIGNQEIVLRRSEVLIDDDNVYLVQFLNYVRNEQLDVLKQKSDLLADYIMEKEFKLMDLEEIVPVMPKKVYIKLRESGVLDAFTQ